MIFIAGILILAGVLWLGFQIAGKRSHNMIRITVDGKEFGTYSLSQDRVIHIGDTNVCEIKDGKVTMIEATCPDHYCMKQKAVDEHGGSIICLPNKVVIEGENTAEDSESSPKIDAVTEHFRRICVMYILRPVFSDRWYSVCDIPATNERIYL